MTGDTTGYVLIVEDEEAVRKWVTKVLRGRGYAMSLEAEHMEDAKSAMRERWADIAFVVMDVMLPRNAADAEKIKELTQARERAYDLWLKLEDEGLTRDNPRWMKARFDIDLYDRRIFDILNIEGGIELIKEYAGSSNGGGKVNKPVLYLTARENEAAKRKGMGLVIAGKSDWLVKPVTEGMLCAAIRRILPMKKV